MTLSCGGAGGIPVGYATLVIVYVALVFVLIGELLSSYLTVATGFPA
jgi:hypothetical protein